MIFSKTTLYFRKRHLAWVGWHCRCSLIMQCLSVYTRSNYWFLYGRIINKWIIYWHSYDKQQLIIYVKFVLVCLNFELLNRLIFEIYLCISMTSLCIGDSHINRQKTFGGVLTLKPPTVYNIEYLCGPHCFGISGVRGSEHLSK